MQKIAVIGGTGRQGFGLAVRWAMAGFRVILGSRDPKRAEVAVERAKHARGELPLRGAGNREAAEAADVVVLTIPFSAQEEILPSIRAAVAGKVVIDTTVPLRSFSPPVLEVPPAGSAAQRARELLSDARVAAAFHTVSAVKLNAFDTPLEEDTLVCGEEGAKEAGIVLAERIGLRGLDAGPLEAAATLERLGALLVALNQRYRRRAIGVRFVGL
jgi:NADPH-dependent F420 reductase